MHRRYWCLALQNAYSPLQTRIYFKLIPLSRIKLSNYRIGELVNTRAPQLGIKRIGIFLGSGDKGVEVVLVDSFSISFHFLDRPPPPPRALATPDQQNTRCSEAPRRVAAELEYQ